MNNVIKRITIDISNENSFHWLEAVQGDSISRCVYISLLDNGVPYSLDNIVPVIRGEKSDGTSIFNSCQLTDNGEIIVELTSQMLSAAGKSIYEIALYGPDMEVLTSFPFYLSVSPASFCPEKIVSTDEYTMIADIMKNVNNLYDAVSEATAQAEISAEKAGMSADSAKDAAESAEAAKASETAAADSETIAAANAAQAQDSAAAAKASETNAAGSETAASNSETNAKASENNAKNYLDTMEEIANSFEGTLRPKGEILFEDLPSVSTAEIGDMYTVTNRFVTTADFTNGTNIAMPPYVSIYKAENGKWTALDGNLSTDMQTSLDSYYQQSTGYTDQKIANLINGAPSTLDTLGEIAQAMADNADVVDALEISIGSKASEAEFDSHVKDKSTHITDAERSGWNDPSPVFTQASTRANIASGEKLSVLMGKIKKFFADLKTVAFSGSYDDLSDKPTIPTVGNGTVTIKQAGTAKGTFTMNQDGDTTIELTDNNTTYKAATQSAAGLMSAADKKKLDGVAAGANSYSLPAATASARGGVKIGYTENGRNYPVQLSDEQMYVNVPWTDTNTHKITGVKGNAESAYRTGNVNITPANIGLGNVNNTADANKSVNYANSAGSANSVAYSNVSGRPTFSLSGTTLNISF